MNFQEKKLYHQIHPLKLLTDWLTGAISLYYIWHHKLFIAFIVMFIPAIVVSLFIICFIELEKQKLSAFGRYIRTAMTTRMEVIRFVGFVVLLLAAWFHIIWLFVLGLLIILYGWFRGMLFSK